MADWWQQVDLINPSPAKINLFLHVVGRRHDGYHLLQTAFQFLDYVDNLGFSLRTDGAICLKQPLAHVPVEQDLVYKAAVLLQQHAKVCEGVDIYRDKYLPIGGGLGGGSSNAATTLVSLNQLWQLGYTRAQLMDLGLQLGADVPIFIYGHSAWAEGVGERLSSIYPPEAWFLVLTPPCFVATSEIFNDSELTRDSPTSKMCDLLALADNEQTYTLFGRNDCEQVTRRRYPVVDKTMVALADYAQPRLTGTGGCVFAVFAQRSRALEVLAKLRPTYEGFVAKGMNLSPLSMAES
jgi:4-diphosphocytidyl-2-C-methyl-D-erythritol kinase